MERKPNFENILKVLNREEPDRPTLFEFFMCNEVYEKLAGFKCDWSNVLSATDFVTSAFRNAGYDYACFCGGDMCFPTKGAYEKEDTISLNNGCTIESWDDFNAYNWPDAKKCCYDALKFGGKYLGEGMKFIPSGPGGHLENVISLVGYDNLCYMLVDEPELAKAIFDKVGQAFVDFYEICASFDSVGATLMNDDWGFNSATMISPSDLRKYVFPWHKKMVEASHKYNKPAILHSCGNLSEVMDDIIYDMKYDAKHSYEDKILPVEQAYEQYHDKIAIVGGIDINYMATKTPEQIRDRSLKLFEMCKGKGGYALGTGNSVPAFIPFENYKAMIDVIKEL